MIFYIKISDWVYRQVLELLEKFSKFAGCTNQVRPMNQHQMS